MAEQHAYKKAGVDIEAGEKAVELIKKYVRSTFRSEVLGDIGSFGGLFAFDNKKYKEPVLVSATDGVGTKLKIAQMANKHSTVGIDLVAMCANDIVTQGAEPLFFLDYLACGKLVSAKVTQIVEGIAKGCLEAGCALLGGETAEMPGFYSQDEYDLAGFVVGVVEKEKIIDGSQIEEGNLILGISSSGLHSNGYSLVRKVFLEEKNYNLADFLHETGSTLEEELLKPTEIYVKPLLELIKICDVKGLAHITGGGFSNIVRILPDNLDAVIDKASWEVPPVFRLVQEKGKVIEDEMFQTFNMGVGMAVILPGRDVEKAVDILTSVGKQAFKIGEVLRGSGTVKFS